MYEPMSFLRQHKDNDEPYYWRRSSSSGFPSWSGQGATFSFWYQHCDYNPYVLAAHTDPFDARGQCWGFWMHKDGFGFNSMLHDIWINVHDLLTPDYYLRKGEWRHIAVQLDAADDALRVFVDGSLMHEEHLAAGVVAQLDASCNGPDAVVAVGHAFPGWYQAGDLYLADLRVYVEEEPLSADDVLFLAAHGSSSALVLHAYHLEGHEGVAPQVRRLAHLAAGARADHLLASAPFSHPKNAEF